MDLDPAALVTNALGMAIDSRHGASLEAGPVIHSVHGAQFASWAFTKRAKDSGLVPSTGSIGDCYDNSMIESCWSRMQLELLDRQRWTTRIELAKTKFDYIEIWQLTVEDARTDWLAFGLSGRDPKLSRPAAS